MAVFWPWATFTAHSDVFLLGLRSVHTHANTLREEQKQSETWFRVTFTVKRKLLSCWAWSQKGHFRGDMKTETEERGRRQQLCDIPQMFVGLGWLRSENPASAWLLYTSCAQQQQQQQKQLRVSRGVGRVPLPSVVIFPEWAPQQSPLSALSMDISHLQQLVVTIWGV